MSSDPPLSPEDVSSAAWALPQKQRAHLAATLLASLSRGGEDPSDPDQARAWKEDLLRRVHGIDEEVVDRIPWDRIREDIDASRARLHEFRKLDLLEDLRRRGFVIRKEPQTRAGATIEPD